MSAMVNFQKAAGEYQRELAAEANLVAYRQESAAYQAELAAEAKALESKKATEAAQPKRKITRNKVTFNPLATGKSFHGHSLKTQAGQIDAAVVDYIRTNKKLPEPGAIARMLELSEYRVEHHIRTCNERDGRYDKLAA